MVNVDPFLFFVMLLLNNVVSVHHCTFWFSLHSWMCCYCLQLGFQHFSAANSRAIALHHLAPEHLWKYHCTAWHTYNFFLVSRARNWAEFRSWQGVFWVSMSFLTQFPRLLLDSFAGIGHGHKQHAINMLLTYRLIDSPPRPQGSHGFPFDSSGACTLLWKDCCLTQDRSAWPGYCLHNSPESEQTRRLHDLFPKRFWSTFFGFWPKANLHCCFYGEVSV